MIRENTSCKEMAQSIARRFEKDGLRAEIQKRSDGYFDVIGVRA